jgi:polysaccharide chain length determinant protein (PEP-CTERM system associated)
LPEDFEDKPSEGIDRQHLFGLARRHTWHFLVPFFLGWLVVWAASWFMPSVYRSGTLILIQQPTVPEEFVVPNVAGDLQGRLQSITQQILSRTRLLHIIDQFNLYSKYRRESPDELVERMRKDIDIELVHSEDGRSLTAFNVFYSGDNPKAAQAVVTELTSLFISENLDVRQRQSETTTSFLENQLESARKDLAAQEAKVRDFKDQHLGELPGQQESNLQILTGLQNQLQSEQDGLNRAKQQNTYLQSLLTQYHTLQNSSRTGDAAPMGLPAIDQELDRLKAQLADLSAHYTEKHPDVRKVKEQIAKTERLKQQIEANLSQPRTPDSNATPAPRSYAELDDRSPMFQLTSQLNANNTEISNHENAIRLLQGRIGEYQGRLNQEPVREQQLADLTRGYEQSKTDYDSLLKKRNESELATNMELQQQGEHFRILDQPSLPVKPYSPNRLKLFAIGLFAGIGLGGTVSVAKEMTDDRIFSEKQLKQLLPAEVLGEIPDLATVEEQKISARLAWFRWIAAGAVFASLLVAFAVTFLRG